jgi:hypothetical protein
MPYIFGDFVEVERVAELCNGWPNIQNIFITTKGDCPLKSPLPPLQ